jgi:hypothetical protein
MKLTGTFLQRSRKRVKHVKQTTSYFFNSEWSSSIIWIGNKGMCQGLCECRADGGSKRSCEDVPHTAVVLLIMESCPCKTSGHDILNKNYNNFHLIFS